MSLVICFDCRATLLPNFHERNKKDRNPSRHRGEAKGEEIRNEIGGCGPGNGIEYPTRKRLLLRQRVHWCYCQSARLHTWIYMVLYHGDHVTSSTGYTIQKCILQLVIITAQIVEIAGFV
ncbi:hypothetical protein ACN38_g12349, partial [Penicillium nordicum]